jgi:NAD(P)-dependent dehydrogenase (short-subunit alcohol dehydrogenase family)
VLDPDAVEALAAAVRRFGHVDVWVHSAAVVAYGRFEDVPAPVFRRSSTRVCTAQRMSRAALRRFRAQGYGTLVLVGSLLGEIATPYMSGYVTGKWAVRGLARSLAVETRRDRRARVGELLSEIP